MIEKEFITVKEYAQRVGKSKQYINQQTLDGKLNFYLKDGLKYVQYEGDTKSTLDKQFNQQVDNEMVDYLKEQVERLTARIETLEQQLFDCKGESLNKIVEIQEKKDAQLQQYIEFLNNSTQQLIANVVKKEESEYKNTQQETDLHEAEIIEDEIEPVELMAYLKSKHYKKDYRATAKEKVRKLLLKDSRRFTIIDKKIYIYPTKHNYSDIL